ncbi:MAG TPA: 16S rRNA (guanine(966)-N(2))-methyltransferase RsmD [Salegentibacter sp.]|nr:16S rRNA (guanine(966)-N(2))-methyltransferase RsmD [Salegentibacter sp.]
MRIISGKNKGKRLTAPKKLPVRPTTDMAKEALFNILNNRFNLNGIAILDLFSGTGNIAYEFASRGASQITAVDENFDCIKFIKKTSEELDMNINVIKSDVYKYLEKAPIKSDIIFADPPYDFEPEAFQKIISLVFEKGLLNEDGTLILEHSKHTDLSETPHFTEARKYGSSAFSFFE